VTKPSTNTKQLSVLIVDEDPGRSTILEQALRDGGFNVLAKLSNGEQLATQVEKHQPDVIIIDLDSPDRDTLENMYRVNQTQPRPIVMFVEDDDGASIDRIIAAGVSAYVVDGLNTKRVKPIVDMAVARFREYQALRDELEKTKSSLEERKLIDRAKGILIKKRGCSEEEAYQTLRRSAMDRGQRLADVARTLIDMIDLLE
jgi:response regulator NasT